MIVLLVEDDAELEAGAGDRARSGVRGTELRDGTDGLQRLRTERVDVLLTDLDLPGVSGEALAARGQDAAQTACPSWPCRPIPRAWRPAGSWPMPSIAKPSPLAAVKAALRRATRSAGWSGRDGPIARAALGLAVLATIACAASPTATVWKVDALQGPWTMELIEKAGGPVTRPPSGASFTAVFEADGSPATPGRLQPVQRDVQGGGGDDRGQRPVRLHSSPPARAAPLDRDYVTLVSSAKEWSVKGEPAGAALGGGPGGLPPLRPPMRVAS